LDLDCPNRFDDSLLSSFSALFFLRRLMLAIELAFSGGSDANPAHNRQRVHNIQLVRGRDFYGYHSEDSLFMKVVL
jgi:hypothetical protein